MANWSQAAVDDLAMAVSGRRTHLGRSQLEAWKRGGPSNSTMTSVENAVSTSITSLTLHKLDMGLDWPSGTSLKLLRREVTPEAAVHIPEGEQWAGLVDDETTEEFEQRELEMLDKTIAKLETDLANALQAGRDSYARLLRNDLDGLQSRRMSLQAEHDWTGRLTPWIELSFLADDVDAAIPVIAPEPEETGEVETYIEDVQELIRAAESLTDGVHKAVLHAVGGDLARLRQLKREIRRANLAAQGLIEKPLFDDQVVDDPPRPELDSVREDGQADYDLAGGNRQAGPSEGRRRREDQDRDAEDHSHK